MCISTTIQLDVVKLPLSPEGSPQRMSRRLRRWRRKIFPMRRPETPTALKGRGTTAQPANRFAKARAEAVDDGWDVPHYYDADGEQLPSMDGPMSREAGCRERLTHIPTTVTDERARSIISRNDSPDIGFSQSINPYRGCEHGLTLW